MRGLRLFALLLAIAAPSVARAEYPERAIRMVVPQAAGSATDTVARILAAEMTRELGGVQIVVDDKPGAALTLGLDLVAKSTPDGYTIGIGPIGALAITRHMMAKLKLYCGPNHPHQAQCPIPLEPMSGRPTPAGALFIPTTDAKDADAAASADVPSPHPPTTTAQTAATSEA